MNAHKSEQSDRKTILQNLSYGHTDKRTDFCKYCFRNYHKSVKQNFLYGQTDNLKTIP